MLKRWIGLVIVMLFALAACHSPHYDQTEGNVADVKIKAANARKKSDNDAKPAPPLVVKKGLYVDTTPIDLDREPGWLNAHVVIRGDQLPFSYYSRTVASAAGSRILTKYQTGLDSNIRVSLNYAGTVKGALDLLASKTGYVYVVHGKTVLWQAFVTKTFDVAFMPGSSDYLVGNGADSGSGGGGSGQNGIVSNYTSSDSSQGEYSTLKGNLSIWTDLEKTIKEMLSPNGRVIVSESTTSVTVRDKPTNVALVEQYMKNMNQNLSKQVLVKVQVLEIGLQSAYAFGIDWNVVQNAFANSPFHLRASYGTPISIDTLTPSVSSMPNMGTERANDRIPGYTILFKALSQQGKTAIVSEPRVVCLNNQVSVVRIVTQEGYVASIQNTSLAGSSSGGSNTNIGTVTSQVTPGTVITGLTLYILPKILQNDIYLQVNADLSTNNGFKTFSTDGTSSTSTSSSSTSSNGSTIQLPNITQKHFNQRSVIKSGDTLILSGFRQVKNIANAQQLYEMQALGGKGSFQQNIETVVLITPIILHGSA